MCPRSDNIHSITPWLRRKTEKHFQFDIGLLFEIGSRDAASSSFSFFHAFAHPLCFSFFLSRTWSQRKKNSPIQKNHIRKHCKIFNLIFYPVDVCFHSILNQRKHYYHCWKNCKILLCEIWASIVVVCSDEPLLNFP